MTPPKLILILSENWTLTSSRDLRSIVRFAAEAEDAGFDAVMVSEHVVLGPDADADGLPSNPRDYALPGNQDPATPWPSSLVLLSAVAAATTRLRLVAGAIIPPLRHPLLVAKDLATLDLLSEGRLVVQPTVSWHRPEYDALGVPFGSRGELLDEHLAAWDVLWRDSPASFDGTHYRFHDVYLEPKPFRPEGPTLWFGGSSLHDRLVDRIVTYGDGFNPLGRPSPRICRDCMRRWPRRAGASTSSRWWAGHAACSPIRRAWPTSHRRCPRSRNRSRLGSRRSASSRLSSSMTPSGWARSAARSWNASRRS